MARTRNGPPSSPNKKTDIQNGIQAAAYPLRGYPQDNDLGRNIVEAMMNGDHSAIANQAWAYYKTIPELHFLATYLSNAMSMVRLFIGEVDASDPDNPTEVGPRHPARELMRNFAGGAQGQGEVLARLATHLTVVGDSVLMGPSPTAGVLPHPYNNWKVYSSNEVNARSGRVYLRDPNFREQQIPSSVMPVRIWKPDPQFWWKSDSPVYSAFGVLREIELMDAHIHASAISRLKSAGILFIPEEFTLPGDEVEIEGEDGDPFVRVLVEVMQLAIKNPESAAALVPIILRGPAEFAQSIKLIDFNTPFDQQVSDLRTEAIRRLALAMDTPPEILLGSGGSSSWCVDPSTEILTTEGWKTYDQITPGSTTVRTLNHETGLAEWQTLSDLAVFEVENEQMLSIEGKTHSSLTTMNHRWPTRTRHGRDRRFEREWKTSEHLNSSDWIYTGALSGDLPIEAKYSDAFVELMAWFYTEGHISRRGDKRRGDIRIVQSETKNEDKFLRIKRALDIVCPGQYGIYPFKDGSSSCFNIYVGPSRAFLELVNDDKAIDPKFIMSLTQSQLELFINTSLDADRCSRLPVLGQDVPERLYAFELACILAGHSTNYIEGNVRSKSYKGYEWDSQCFMISQHSRNVFGPREKHKTLVEYTGTVWCPVTPNGSWLARRNGHVFFTGNSMWQVSEATERMHVRPLSHLICASLTEGWLKPALAELPLADQTRENVPNLVVWPDFTALRIAVDPAADLNALYQNMAISQDVYRHHLGFGEDEAPTPKEVQYEILLEVIKTNPQLAPWAIDALNKDFGFTFPKPDEVATATKGIVSGKVAADSLSPASKDAGINPATGTTGTPKAAPSLGTAPKIPGQRSRDKQTAPPKAPPADGDGNNNIAR